MMLREGAYDFCKTKIRLTEPRFRLPSFIGSCVVVCKNCLTFADNTVRSVLDLQIQAHAYYYIFTQFALISVTTSIQL